MFLIFSQPMLQPDHKMSNKTLYSTKLSKHVNHAKCSTIKSALPKIIGIKNYFFTIPVAKKTSQQGLPGRLKNAVEYQVFPTPWGGEHCFFVTPRQTCQ